MSVSPVAGVMVREPNVPGGTSALAAPFTSSADPAVTAATTVPDISRINIFFCTMSLIFARRIWD
jgi:hypothetical protein